MQCLGGPFSPVFAKIADLHQPDAGRTGHLGRPVVTHPQTDHPEPDRVRHIAPHHCRSGD